MICHYYEAPTYLFFAADLPALLYYSHIPTAILALLIGMVLLVNNPGRLVNRLLFSVTALFGVWTILNLITWTAINSGMILFSWSMMAVVDSLIAIFSIYFVYVFTHEKDAPLRLKAALVALVLPVILFVHTNLNLSGFNISDCDAFGYEGFWYDIYYTSLSAVAIIWSLYFFIKRYKQADRQFRKQIIMMAVGINFFLLTFFSVVWLAGYLTTIGVFEDSDLELYGMFGMSVFMVLIGVLVVKFKTFRVGILASQALVVLLLILLGAQFTYLDLSLTSSILNGVALIITAVIGFLLVKSVKKEVQQRKNLQNLTEELAFANEKLMKIDKLKSEFVSIASHQLRSPLTTIRGYASLLVEESFGKLPEKALESVNRIAESARLMTLSIEDFLNVSRIESGNMKYNLSEFNVRDKAEEVCDDLRPVALKKSLILLFKNDLKGRGLVNADVGKTVQIIHNLINNSIKYTEKGTITVFVHDEEKNKKIFIEIIDTGIGMSQKTISSLFGKFSRADNANSVNVSGTGLGLFVARRMAEAMGGDITAYSEGDGKGSRFVLTMPYVM